MASCESLILYDLNKIWYIYSYIEFIFYCDRESWSPKGSTQKACIYIHIYIYIYIYVCMYIYIWLNILQIYMKVY